MPICSSWLKFAEDSEDCIREVARSEFGANFSQDETRCKMEMSEMKRIDFKARERERKRARERERVQRMQM